MTEPRLDLAGWDAAARERSPWWSVHASRYLFARRYARGRVLDIACGTGYGLSLLGPAARRVIGVDADVETARTAAREAGGAASVLVADGVSLPFDDATFECVTSFETIEHLEARPRFVAELRRVLRHDGICVLSTPNANYTQPIDGRPRNRFHVHEYAPDELGAELAPHFASVDLLGQALNPRFVMSPFWDDQQRMPRTLKARSHRWLWRLVNRLPRVLQNAVSERVWGQPFLPGVADYDFLASTVGSAPVLVAVCLGAR